MERLSRRDYNRQLWSRAAAGMSWKAHLISVAAALVAGAIRYLISGRPFESALLLNVGIPVATFIVIELAIFCFRRFFAAPHELYEQQLQKNIERDAEIDALRGQVLKLPTPRLMLTYTVESVKGFEDEVSNPKILLHNEGDTAAVEVHLDALQLTQLIKVTFASLQRIGAQETATVAPRVEIRTDSGGWELNHNEKHFGLAIQRAHAELVHRNVKTEHGSRRWPMTLRYYDAGGASYTQNYDLMLHVPTMKAWTVFVPPPAKP